MTNGQPIFRSPEALIEERLRQMDAGKVKPFEPLPGHQPARIVIGGTGL